jgi:hypothetical protein
MPPTNHVAASAAAATAAAAAAAAAATARRNFESPTISIDATHSNRIDASMHHASTALLSKPVTHFPATRTRSANFPATRTWSTHFPATTRTWSARALGTGDNARDQREFQFVSLVSEDQREI